MGNVKYRFGLPLSALAVALLWSRPAWANAGIAAFHTAPAFCLAFILVVRLERRFLRRRLGLSPRRAICVAVGINLVSTLWGFPTLFFLKYPHRFARLTHVDLDGWITVVFFVLAWIVTVLVEFLLLLAIARWITRLRPGEGDALTADTGTKVETRAKPILSTAVVMNLASYLLLIAMSMLMPTDWQLGSVPYPDGIFGEAYFLRWVGEIATCLLAVIFFFSIPVVAVFLALRLLWRLLARKRIKT